MPRDLSLRPRPIADFPRLAPYRRVLADCGVRTFGELADRIEAGERLAWSLDDLRGVPGIGREDEEYIVECVRKMTEDGR